MTITVIVIDANIDVYDSEYLHWDGHSMQLLKKLKKGVHIEHGTVEVKYSGIGAIPCDSKSTDSRAEV